MNNSSQVPFSGNNLAEELLNSIFSALAVCHNNWLKNNETKPEDLKENFDKFLKHPEHVKTGKNEFLKVGYNSNDDYRSRLALITINNFSRVKKGSAKSNAITLPSPLYILNQVLTVPEEPSSMNYALHYCRSYLFEKFKTFPEHPYCPEGFRQFNISDLSQVLFTFKSHVSDGNNITKAYANPIFPMLAHFLAAKGFFYLRFPADDKKDKESALLNQYLEDKDIDGKGDSKKIEFHLLDIYTSIPNADSLYNELAGVLIPIRGLDIVFQGGLLTDKQSSLVLRVSGKPGTGKTSFALGLAASLSPFDTFTYYISIEENKFDLRNRLSTLIPEYLKRMSIFNSEIDDWFVAQNVELEDQQNVELVQKNYIEAIKNEIKTKRSLQTSNNMLPSMCPLIVVVDSIRFFEENNLNKEMENRQKLIDFIAECRKLQCLVILLSGDEENINKEIEYLVDVVITLQYEKTLESSEKPFRVFSLTKSRHQISRPGAHIFHLSGENGFRISPQLSSQQDRKDVLKRQLPSKNKVILTFSSLWTSVNRLFISNNSQILIEGLGSSGKSGFSLNILLTPPVDKDYIDLSKIESLKGLQSRKILIISFLYPKEYYDSLTNEIIANLKGNYKDLTGKIDCLYLFSAFLRPEDLISMVLRKLEEAVLNGEPFTGVLIDGLHNIALGFHRIQDSDIIWPTLYNLLLRYKVTLVTTFTRFQVTPNLNKVNNFDSEIMLRGQYPLLHTLVQATDYHFNVEPDPEKMNNRNTQGKYIVNLISAINHPMQGERYIWDREKKIISKHSAAPRELFD